MNRFIIGRLGVVSLLAALLALGCAIEQSSDGGDDQTETGDESSQMVGTGTTGDEQVSAGEGSLLKHNTDGRRPESGVCPGCGPLPDPWKKMGPLPDPWSSSSSSSGGESSSSGGESSTSGGAKTNK